MSALAISDWVFNVEHALESSLATVFEWWPRTSNGKERLQDNRFARL